MSHYLRRHAEPELARPESANAIGTTSEDKVKKKKDKEKKRRDKEERRKDKEQKRRDKENKRRDKEEKRRDKEKKRTIGGMALTQALGGEDGATAGIDKWHLFAPCRI